MRPAFRFRPGGPRRVLRALSLGLLALVPLAPAAAQRGWPGAPRAARRNQPPPVTLDAEAGLRVGDRSYVRSDRLTPIRVLLGNNPVRIRGDLELRGPDGAVTRMAVELPPGSLKEYTLFALLDETIHPNGVRLVLRQGRRELASAVLRPVLLGQRGVFTRRYGLVRPPVFVPAHARLVIAVGGDGTGLQFLNREPTDLAEGEETAYYRAAHRLPAELPRVWAGYEPADVVVLNGAAWRGMDPDQRRALRAWVEQGGTAILCSGTPGDWSDPEGRVLCPVRPEGWMPVRSLRLLSDWGRAPWQSAGGALPVVTGSPLPGGRVLAAEGGRAVAVKRRTVRGNVLWIGLDGFRETLRSWEGYPAFWREAIETALDPAGADPVLSPDQAPHATAAAGAIPSLPVPPPGLIVAFGALYAFVFGPLNIWILRRLRRTVRAWLVMPTLAGAMTLVLLFAGQSWGSSRAVLNEVAVLETASGARSAVEEALIGLFSPTNRAFDLLQNDPVPGLSETDANSEEKAPRARWPARLGDDFVRWDDFPLQLYSTRTLRVRRSLELGGGVTVRLPARGPGEVENGTSLPLRAVYLYRNGGYRLLGDLPPGGRVPVPERPDARRPEAMEAPAGDAGADPSGRFEAAVRQLWASAPVALLSPSARRQTWLIALCSPPPALDVPGIGYRRRAALLLVRVP